MMGMVGDIRAELYEISDLLRGDEDEEETEEDS